MNMDCDLGCPRDTGREPATDEKVLVIFDSMSVRLARNLALPAHQPSDAIFIGFTEDQVFITTDLRQMEREHHCCILFAVGRDMCQSLFGFIPPLVSTWYLPAKLRGLCQTVLATDGNDGRADLLRIARCTEVLCSLFGALSDQRLVQASATPIREQDILSILAAHRIVSDEWHRPLTLRAIAQRCGLSRTKLARGFRDMYRCSISEAVAEQRLEGARRLITQSDLHIATVGYRCGYTNNASFSRAFARRFGVTASAMRQRTRRSLGRH